MGVEPAGGARYGGRDHGGQDQRTGDVNPDRGGQRLVLAQRDHGPAQARAHQPGDHHVGQDAGHQHQVVVGHLAPEGQLPQAGDAEGERRDVVERHRSLGQVDPVERHQAHDLGEADGHDDEVGAADLERDPADQPAEEPGHQDAGQQADPHRARREHEGIAVGDLEVEAERDERAGVSADAEEGDVAEAQLPGIAEQQVEAHGRDDEDARVDEDIQIVLIGHPDRNREQEGQPQPGRPAVHPMRSARANSPVGRKIRTTMIMRNPMASR